MNSKKKNMGDLRRLFLQVWHNYKLRLLVIFVLILFSSFVNVYGSSFLQRLIDDYITPLVQGSEHSFAPLAQAILIMCAIYLTGILATYTWNRLMIKVSLGTLNDTREELFAHMEKLPVSYYDTHSHGDIMSIYTNDTDTLRQLISQAAPQVLSSGGQILFVIGMMLYMNWQLAIVTLVMGCVILGTARYITANSGKYFKIQQQQLGKVNGFIEEMMEGTKVVKVFTHEQQAIADFEKVNEQLCAASTSANIFANILMPVCANIGYISYVFTAMMGAYFAINGMFGMTLGTIAAFLQLNRNFNNPITQISQQINAVVMAGAGAARIFALLDEPVETDNGKVTLVRAKLADGHWEEAEEWTGYWCWRHPRANGEVELVPLKGDVRFHDVDFSYNPDKQVLYDINLFAKPGQKIAFVGATGAGKTTITNLINRFYDIQHGSITYDGIDVKLIKKDDLRRSLGIVLQDTNLFSGTIMENIRFGNLKATDEECIAAAKLARADDFIQHLEHGYDTVISGNSDALSQGQKQLIAIARAAVANPPVLILDEATSSIDTRTERLVQEGMDSLMHGRTTFVIAHRLSTIMNSNAIMVLDNGHIIERGDHDDLIKQEGTYYQLYTGKIKNG